MNGQKNHFKLYKINGVGVDLARFYPVDSLAEKNKLRRAHGFHIEDFILIYTAEFIPRKNHQLLFDILPSLKRLIPELRLILCGKGQLLEDFQTKAEDNKMDYVHFTGYTKDIPDWCRLSDVLIMPSFQEGLPIAMVEAIATGLPVVASNIRGHVDVIKDCINGFLFPPKDQEGFIKAVYTLYENPMLRQEMGMRNIDVAQNFSVKKTVSAMADIYHELIYSI